MRLALHIFKKDVRRLWWEIAVATGAVAYLAYMDSNRMDYLPGPMEGLMNLVVPAAWAYLIAMLAHQESLVGDRQFWLTRPYPRGSLLAAKLLFVLCFIHVVSLVFDMSVVQARGFNAFAHLPVLMTKQATLAAALTVPALALAALTRNLAQFVSVGLLCLIAGYLLTSNYLVAGTPVEAVRENVATLLIATGAVLSIALQYTRRHTVLARSIAAGLFTSAVLMAAYTPRRYTTAAACRSGPQIAVTLSQHGPPPPDRLPYFTAGTRTAAVPVVLTGVPARAIQRFTTLNFEVTNHRGRWSMPPMPVRLDTVPPRIAPVSSWLYVPEGERIGWMLITIDQKLLDTMSAQPVRVRGRFAGTLVLLGETRELPVEAYGVGIPEIGRCATLLVQNVMSMYQNEMLKSVCESPDQVPRARVELVNHTTGRRLRQGLGDSGMHVRFPTRTWLSPVHRRNTSFRSSTVSRYARAIAGW